MDASFWHDKWHKDEIGFHEGRPNALLEGHFGEFLPAGGQRVLVPLCGKSRDVAWLLRHGYRVAGVELSEKAVKALFAELDLEPERLPAGPLECHRAEGLEVFVGDIFELGTEALGPVDAVYDRAALVALPEDTRPRYAQHVVRLSGTAPQFLITFTYDQERMAGPPFAVPPDAVARYYGAEYEARLATRRPVAGGLKGRCEATEDLWLLHPRPGARAAG